MIILDEEAKALKKLHENEYELAFILYLPALGFVTAVIGDNKKLLSEQFVHETNFEDYEQALALRVTGKYKVGNLEITDYKLEKDA